MAQSLRVLQHQEIPSEIQQLAAAQQLGTPTAEYKGHMSKSMLINLIVGIVFLVIAIVLALLSLTPGNNSGVLLACLVFGLIGLVCTGYALPYALIYSHWRVYTCPEGFIFTKGKQNTIVRWDQIVSLSPKVTRNYMYGIYVGTTHKYALQGKDGIKVLFDDKFRDVENLGNTLVAEVTKRRPAAALEN